MLDRRFITHRPAGCRLARQKETGLPLGRVLLNGDDYGMQAGADSRHAVSPGNPAPLGPFTTPVDALAAPRSMALANGAPLGSQAHRRTCRCSGNAAFRTGSGRHGRGAFHCALSCCQKRSRLCLQYGTAAFPRRVPSQNPPWPPLLWRGSLTREQLDQAQKPAAATICQAWRCAG